MSKMTSMTRTASSLSGDTAQLVAAIERLHAGGFAVETLTVGKASVTLRRAAAAGEQRDDERPAPDGVYNRFGNEVLTQIAAEVLPGVDLQPAIGRRAG